MTLLQYLLKFSISLSVLYFFYQLVLRRLTFYNWNRWYLLGYSFLCFIIPFINISFIVERGALQHSKFIGLIPVMEQMGEEKIPFHAASRRVDLQFIYLIVIVIGAAFVTGRLLLQYYSLQRLRKQGTILHDEKVKLFHIDKNILPFSFGNTIYVNKYLHTEEELKEIIHHEFIHVRQQHSVDILWSEFLCIINWFNPFAWLLRKAIRQNLEFIADHKVLENGVNRKQYQYLLLKVTGATRFSITNNFNFSSLKNRIAMMNSVKSARLNLVKFLFLLPLLIVLLLSFRQAQTRHSQHKTAVASLQGTDTVPPPPPPPSNPPKKAEVRVKVPAPPAPPQQPVVSTLIINGDTLTTHEVNVTMSTEPILKTLTNVKPITLIEPKIQTVTTIKSDIQNSTIAKVELSGIKTGVKPTTSTLTDLKPITSVIESNNIVIAEGSGEEVLVLTNKTTKEQLEQMKKDIESKGYELTIKDVTYSDDKVVTIKGTIRKGDDWGSFESKGFQKFVISYADGKNPRFLVSILHGSIIFNNNAE